MKTNQRSLLPWKANYDWKWVEDDDVAKEVLMYILKNKFTYFNQIAADFSRHDIASRNTLFGKMLALDKVGILQADLVRIEYGEKSIQKWVKKYTIPQQNLTWVLSLDLREWNEWNYLSPQQTTKLSISSILEDIDKLTKERNTKKMEVDMLDGKIKAQLSYLETVHNKSLRDEENEISKGSKRSV